MIVKTRLAEIQEELSRQFDKVTLKGQGLSSFLYVVHNGRGVEISEENGGFWLEFWDKSDDEDAGPVKEITVVNSNQAIQEAARWLV
jgi:hypothetical protein